MNINDKYITILFQKNSRSFPLDDVKIKIKGMMCGHCEKTVTEALKSVKGVTKASSDFKNGEAIVSFDSSLTSLETIKKAIKDAGYEILDEDEACPRTSKTCHH
jgi:copper chaperone CopZ